MAYDVQELITRTQQKLDDPSFDTTTLISFANDTEREVFNRLRINIQETQLDTITTTAASRDLTGLPTSPAVLTYISLRIISPINYSKVIPYMEYEDSDLVYPNYLLLGQGPPIGWFIFDGTPHLVNLADKTYTLSAKYTNAPTKLTAVGNTPNITEEFSEIAVLGMYARALEFNDEYNQAQTVRGQFQRLCNDYVDATRRQAGVVHQMRRSNQVNRKIGLR